MTRIKLFFATLGVIGLIAFAGCGGKEDAKSMSKEKVFEKSKAMMKSMADVMTKNKDDCPAMGKALQKLVDDSKPLRDRMKELEKDPEAKTWVEEQGKAMQEEAMKIMGPAMQAAQGCMTDESVTKAMESMR